MYRAILAISPNGGMHELQKLTDERMHIALLEKLDLLRTRTIFDTDYFKGSTSHEYESFWTGLNGYLY